MKILSVLAFFSVIVAAGIAAESEKLGDTVDEFTGLRNLGDTVDESTGLVDELGDIADESTGLVDQLADTVDVSTGLRNLGDYPKCKYGEKDRGCGCGKPKPGPCGCNKKKDRGCGCGKPKPGPCGCNDKVDLGCGCGKPAPGPCGCNKKKDRGCGCGKPAPGPCGCNDEVDKGCGCGKPGPGPCGCNDKVDLGCGCGKPAPGKCGCKDHCEPKCGYWDNHIWLYYSEDLCVQWGHDDWAVMAHCSKTDPYQEWYFDKGYIKSVKYPSYCLSYKTSGHSRKWLYVAKCSGNKNQKWVYDHYRISPVNRSSKCVDVCRDCGGGLYLETCESHRDHDQKFSVGDCFYTGYY